MWVENWDPFSLFSVWSLIPAPLKMIISRYSSASSTTVATD